MTTQGYLLVALATLAYAAFLACVLYLDAKLGGWCSLAAKYPNPGKRPVGGQWWLGERIVLANGASGAAGVLIVSADQVGLTLAMPFFLRVFYPTLFLPWKDVTAVRERGWLMDKVHLTFRAVPDVPVTIMGNLADKILASVGPVWTEPKAS
jgi:hypothetical protein